MAFRIEKDTMGEVQVPADKYWAAQTERSRNNFKIGPAASMPHEIIEAFGYLKKAAAFANCDLGVLPAESHLANRFRYTIKHERERSGGKPCSRFTWW